MEQNEIADLLAPFWSTAETLEALGLTPTQLSERRTAGTILGVETTDDTVFYPLLQFEKSQGQVRVKRGMLSTLGILRELSPWTVGIMLRTPASELDGLTPEEWVRQRRDPGVLEDLARRLYAETRAR